MKRFLILAAMLLLLVGCSRGKTPSQQNDASTVPAAAEVQEAAGTPAQENEAPASDANEPATQTSAAPELTPSADEAVAPSSQDANAQSTSKPFVPEGAKVPTTPEQPQSDAAAESEREPTGLYYFPALQKKENMDNALLYRACEFMVQQYAQFRGAVVNDFEIESAGKSEDSWAQFRVTLYTDRGDYSVVLTENGRFVSDSLQ